jgi:hypothetical protein
MAAGVSGELSGGGRSWSTIATMKIVSSAATEDRTGEVNEMSTRKDPENAAQLVSLVTSWLQREVHTGIREHRNRHHTRLVALGQLKLLPSHIMQNRQRHPQHTQCKQPNQTAKHIRKHNAFIRTRALGRTREALVQHFVEAVQHAAHANHHVAERAVLRFMRRRRFVAACAAPGLRAVFRGRGVAICDDEDAGNGDGDGDDFACAHFFAQDGDAEGIREEGAAIVDGGQVACRCQVYGYVPAAARKGQGAGDEGCHLDHVADGRVLLLARRGVESLVLDGEGDLAQQLGVAAPEDGERRGP